MIRQVSIFIENHEGRLNKMLKILAENRINIRSLNIADATDFGIVRLILQETERGMEILKENNIVASITSVLAAEVSDEPGGISLLVDALTEAKINIAYAYSFLSKKTDKAIIIVRVDDEVQNKAVETLQALAGVNLLDRETLLLK